MSIREVLAASALSLGLVLTLAAAPAAAQPYGKGGNYSLAPRVAPDPRATTGAKAGEFPPQQQAMCVCPMMKRGDAAPHPGAAPGLPG
ncbi:hypothetical protein [Phenylobacterium aquaticum]|uniref:hypothetical protein n=1 Tax=Phenylobacterium aquaticum TaxID=1763816 RepID=UPI001F5D6C38|nr:hypothetical protein [Phenylobacterium aquaticum]MCI3132798.1 hypothetical protein [Phenylobacterium aquaticum]